MKSSKNVKLFVGLCAIFFLGCDNSLSFKTGPDVESPFGDEYGHVSKTLTQRNGDGGAVDILVVVDNSGSMTAEQNKLGDRFGDFISDLQNVDWQMGFINVDMRTNTNYDGFHGRLYDLEGTSQKVLTKNTPDAVNLFKNTVSRQIEVDQCQSGTGPCATGTEEPLAAIIESINLRDGYNSGFFRQDAGLAVLVLSDEDEMSTGPSTATHPQEVLDAVHGAFGIDKLFGTYGMIVEPGDTSCYNDQAPDGQYGEFVDELVSLTEGITGSICDADFSSALQAISERMRANLVIRYALLEHDPAPDSLSVKMVPRNNITWELVGRKIIFSEPPPLGTKIHIDYYYLLDPEGEE